MLHLMNHSPSLTVAVAAELRAYLARQGIRASDLARRMGVTNGWLSRRLSGQTSSTLEDLHLICSAIGIPAGELIANAERASAVGRSATAA